MTTSKFREETVRISNKLLGVGSKLNRTIDVLERLLNAEGEVIIKEWAVRAGKIVITFESPVEIEPYLAETFDALFPTCRYSGTLLEVEASELIG